MLGVFQNRKILVAGFVVPALLLSGCVWQSEYDAVKAENAQLRTSNGELQGALSTANSRIGRLTSAVKYSVNSDMLFRSGDWQLSRQGEETLASILGILEPKQQLAKIVVNGYTDNTPIGSGLRRQGIVTNADLSQKRADTVMQFIVAHGVSPDMVSAHGYGEENPIADNDTSQGRAKNRRVEITAAPQAGS